MYRGRYHPDDALPAGADLHLERGGDATDGASRSIRRIACMLVADFAVAAIARANPELSERPFALARMPSAPRASDARRPGRQRGEYQPHSELIEVSTQARTAGVRSGMTVAQARALVPDLTVTHPSPAAERVAADALIDVAESIAPVVEERAPGCVWIDLTGVQRLYRHSMRVDDESGGAVEDALADELMQRARRLGLEPAVGIASSKETALLAARCGGARVIPPEREREFLDWMPLDLIGLGVNARGDDIELMLKRLGIRRLGEIARLDRHAVGSRLGSAGVELARLASGEGSASVMARRRAESFVEAVELEYGIENLEPLNFILRAKLTQITERLAMRGLAAGDMTLALGLADHRRDDRRVAVAAPTREVRSLLTLLDLSLEASPPPAAVDTIRLAVEPRTPRPAQPDMFLPPSPAPDRLETAIARIAALCGPDRVGTLMPADSYRPEAVRLGRFAPPPVNANGAADAAAPLTSVARMVIRTMRPAEAVEVMCARETPEFVRGRNICARVISCAGPWRRRGEWWAAAARMHGDDGDEIHSRGGGWHAAAPEAYARDYYELALADGAVYRVYRDLYNGAWFVDGVYD